jgi:hypothetical protein
MKMTQNVLLNIFTVFYRNKIFNVFSLSESLSERTSQNFQEIIDLKSKINHHYKSALFFTPHGQKRFIIQSPNQVLCSILTFYCKE